MTEVNVGELIAWLDGLDAARVATTPGPWSVRGTAIEPGVGGTHGSYADAALVVAAVNALEPLTVALRAALDLADEYDRRRQLDADRSSLNARVHKLAADRIRAAVVAAVDGAR